MTTPDTPVRDAIEVIPRAVFVPAHSDAGVNKFAFGYEITIVNHGDAPVQLKTRHWRIDHGNGCIQEVRGDGVVGETPILRPQERFAYRSGAIIESPAGRMWGDYGFEDENGEPFLVPIPAFHLIAPADYRPLH